MITLEQFVLRSPSIVLNYAKAQTRLRKMPRVQAGALPASALFGVAKPSGPSSMAVVNDIKKLVSASRLFVDEKLAKENAEKLYTRREDKDEGKNKGKGKRRRGREVEAKIGQGGTLDPLADGVLGTSLSLLLLLLC